MAEKAKEIGRRDFLKGLGVGVIGSGLTIAGVFTGTKTGIVSDIGIGGAKVAAMPASEGYIVVDSQKCAGCQTCMLACSLVNHGTGNTSLSRIQILQNTFGHFPNDVSVSQCRQCVYPSCVYACPTGALTYDRETGVRNIDEDSCLGCQRCVQACPQSPSRAIWNFEDMHSEKCDLCASAQYFSEDGGPEGKQACVEVCPMKAIKFTYAVPVQTGTSGYNVNLRTANWSNYVPNLKASVAPAPKEGTYFNYTPPPPQSGS